MCKMEVYGVVLRFYDTETYLLLQFIQKHSLHAF